MFSLGLGTAKTDDETDRCLVSCFPFVFVFLFKSPFFYFLRLYEIQFVTPIKRNSAGRFERAWIIPDSVINLMGVFIVFDNKYEIIQRLITWISIADPIDTEPGCRLPARNRNGWKALEESDILS